MKLLLWRTVLLAECFFHSASETSDLSAPLKAPAHLSEPPGRKGAATPPRSPRPGPAPPPRPLPRPPAPPAAPPEPGSAGTRPAGPGPQGSRCRAPGAGAAAGGSESDGDKGGCSSLKVPSCPSPQPYVSEGWASRWLLGIIQREGHICAARSRAWLGSRLFLPHR